MALLSILSNLRPLPDPRRVLENYRRLAAGYDATCGRIECLRQRAVREMRLQPGETVFDIACGTGAALPLLAAEVGPTGRVVGVELSPEMAAIARERAAASAFAGRISVAQCAVEHFRPDMPADVLLLSYTHDVLQLPAALDNLLAMSRPGARIVLLGMKTLPWLWGWPVNLVSLYRARRYLTTYANMDCPWRQLARRGASVRKVHSALWGSAYIAVGALPAQPRA